ncbi:MAG: alcohol dehydrogenase catalytic domain-containing protein [Pseudomonadota bacterium]
MQALFATGKATEPLYWGETDTPVLEATTDAIVRPLAVAACDLDRSIVEGRSPFAGDFVLGHEFTAVVLVVGDEVKGITSGDVVLASFQPSCGECPRCRKQFSSVCQSVPNGTMYGIGPTGGDWGGALTEAVRVPWADYNLAKLPAGCNPIQVASASDNVADGLRGVDGPLERNPGASVLVAGRGSIPLYAVACARHLGASSITVASNDLFVLETAEAMGAECLPVEAWPKRFPSHDITVDCTNSVEGLSAVLQSTAPYGESTSSSIFFGGAVPVPMFNLNMRGISFHTGRVNSAANLDRVLELIQDGLDLESINPAYWAFDDAIEALSSEPFSRKVIVHR